MAKRLLPILFLVFCSSCVTGVVPGEDERILRNLAQEYYAIAQGYAEAKQYEKAIPYYELAARNKEYQKTSQYQIARMNALTSKWEEAEKSYRTLLSFDPDNTDLRASLAYVLAQSGKLGEAEELYRILCEKNPHNEQLLENYIRVLATEKKNEEAAGELARFRERFPQSTSLAALTALVPPPAETPASK